MPSMKLYRLIIQTTNRPDAIAAKAGGQAQEIPGQTMSGRRYPAAITTAAATTSWTADNLMDTLYSCKAQYQGTGEWIMHRLVIRNTRKLKDGNGQYVWQPGLTGGQPDSLLTRPVNASEYAPSTFTTGLYVALFGDLSFYWIADAEDISIQRLMELYALPNQVGFIARSATAGMPVLSEAFARLILA